MKKQIRKSKKESKNIDPEYEIKFWKEWLEADMLKRLDMVEKLPLFKMSLKIEDNKMWKQSFANLVNGYFEDLENACITKYDKEKCK